MSPTPQTAARAPDRRRPAAGRSAGRRRRRDRHQGREVLPDAAAPDVQKILEDEAARAGDEMSAMTLAKQEEFTRALREKGVSFVPGDAAAFEKATQVVYTKFPRWTPGIYERVKAELGS